VGGALRPRVDVESAHVFVGEQVREDVGGAAVEQHVGVARLQRRQRTLQLRDEVLDGRRRGRLVAVLLEQIVGLVDDAVRRQRDRDVLEQR
jgi:hypothetical protein